MAMWVEPEHVLNRWLSGSRPEETSETLLTLIDDAEDEVLRIFPDMQERVAVGDMPLMRLQRVISEIIIRCYKIGQEYRSSYSETTGPFSHSGSMADAKPRNVSLTEDEIRILSPKSGKKAFMVTLMPQWDEYPWREDKLWR